MVSDRKETTVRLNTTTDFSNCLNRKNHIGTILLDFSKYFDKVNHTYIYMANTEDEKL